MLAEIKSAFTLLSPKQQREYWLVAILLTFTSIADMVGIAAIIPAITTLIDFEGAVEKGYLNTLFHFLGQPDRDVFLTIITGGAIAFIWGSAIFSTLGIFARQRFIRRISADMSTRAFGFYMNQPIEPFYSRPASEFLRNVNGVSERIATGIIDASFVLISRSIQLIVIAALLMVFNIRITIFIVLSIAAAYFLAYSSIKKKLKRMNGDNFESQRQLNQMLVGSFADYRNIHIDGRLANFITRFHQIKKQTSKKTANIEILGTVPRNFIEILGMTLLLIAAYRLGQSVDDSHQLVATISLFAVAAYKILPSAQQIYHAVSKITGASVVYQKVKKEWQGLHNQSVNSASQFSSLTPKNIEIQNLHYSHNNEDWVIRNLNAAMKLEGLVRISGPSGSGKTTLLEILAGLRSPQQGRILIDGEALRDIAKDKWWNTISYVNQSGYLMAGTISGNVAGWSDGQDRERYNIVSSICDLNALPNDLITEGGANLSGGQKCRVLMARALYKKSKIVLLDETFSALDVSSAQKIIRNTQNTFPERCLIVVSHRDAELPSEYLNIEILTAPRNDDLTPIGADK